MRSQVSHGFTISPASQPTVVIEFDAQRNLFYTQQEQIELSAERIVAMLHWHLSHQRMCPSWSGTLTITTRQGRCCFSSAATVALGTLYYERKLTERYPCCKALFAESGNR